MKPGDLVIRKKEYKPQGIGIITEWYDSAKGYVIVWWRFYGKNYLTPCHVSKLDLVSEIEE